MADESDSPAERINLVVVFGGESAEHDVSCTTAAHVLRACDPAKYAITPIGISRDGHWSLANEAVTALERGPGEFPGRFEASGVAVDANRTLAESSAAGTTVVLPLLHGPMGEDGTLQGLLELANVAYVGSGVLGSALSMDKAMAKQVLAQHGFAQARFLAYRAHDIRPSLIEHIVVTLGLPCFVKPANMGSSVGVSKAKSLDGLRSAIETALQYDEWVVIEEAIEGREIEVAVLGNLDPKASVAGEIIPGHEFYSYEDKYLDDSYQAVIPARLSNSESDQVRKLAVEIFNALRCDGMARVDFFYEERGRARGWLINEVNTIPGFTPISMFPKLWQATGLAYPDLIDELVRLALERHSRRRRNTAR